jgi:hypothetical protein
MQAHADPRSSQFGQRIGIKAQFSVMGRMNLLLNRMALGDAHHFVGFAVADDQPHEPPP